MSVNIELNSKEINIEICKNALKMLHRRKLLDDVDSAFESISSQINTKASIDFTLNNKTKCSIYPLSAKLSSIVQGTPLDEYLSNDTDIHKIVIVKEFAKKVVKQILDDYKNAEIFFEHELLEDIPSKIFIPEHQILIKEEKEELLNKFSESELSIIYTTDPIARHFNAKVGDIFRIIRPSITSGKSIFYRKVVHGSIDLLFE